MFFHVRESLTVKAKSQGFRVSVGVRLRFGLGSRFKFESLAKPQLETDLRYNESNL